MEKIKRQYLAAVILAVLVATAAIVDQVAVLSQLYSGLKFSVRVIIVTAQSYLIYGALLLYPAKIVGVKTGVVHIGFSAAVIVINMIFNEYNLLSGIVKITVFTVFSLAHIMLYYRRSKALENEFYNEYDFIENDTYKLSLSNLLGLVATMASITAVLAIDWIVSDIVICCVSGIIGIISANKVVTAYNIGKLNRAAHRARFLGSIAAGYAALGIAAALNVSIALSVCVCLLFAPYIVIAVKILTDFLRIMYK